MTASPTPDDARAAIASWRARQDAANPYESDAHLVALADHSLRGARRADLDAVGRSFAAKMTDTVAPAVAAYQAHPPRLERFDGSGSRTEDVVFTADYHQAGTILWRSGLVGRSMAAGSSFEQFVLGYLASLEGEMGHMCAATCTTGLIRVLRRSASDEIREMFLPRLSDFDYSQAWRGAQYLTEVQGGSDVGANAVAAAPAGDGTYRLSGD